MTGRIRVTAILLSLVFLSACEPYPGIDGDNTAQLVAWTNYDHENDFTQYRTFTVTDSMGVVSSDGKAQTVKNRKSEAIREQVILCMETAGYQYQPGSESDLLLTMIEIEQTNISISYDPYNYFWGSYDPWGWGYYYGYPYFPQYYVSSAYTTQTISVQMGDRKNKTLNDEGKEVMTVVWSGSVKGLTGYDRTNTEIRQIIEECFRQTDCAPFNQ